jgi:hypothetical protein
VLATFGQRRFELRGRLAGDAAERDHSWLDGTFLPALSADGTQMVFQEWGDGGGMSATAYHWRAGDPAPKRLGKGTPWSVSPDWTTVLIGGDGHADPKLMPMGAGETVTLPRGPVQSYVWGYWHPDGKRVVYLAAGTDGKTRLYVQDRGGEPPRALAEASALLAFTPDGRFAVARPKAGQPCAYYPLDGGQPQPIPFLLPGETPRTFGDDGRSLYVATLSGACTYRVVRLDLKTGKRTPWLELTPPDQAGAFAGNPVCERKVWITPDGRYYLYGYTRYLQDLYLIEGLK